MRRIATLALLLALIMPASALASGSATCQAYNPQLCTTISGTDGTPATTGRTSAKTLPFTGLDAGLLVGGGLALLAAGVAVRVVSRRLT
jgi:hypothetical protein